MNRVTITIHVDLPDGVIPDVGYGAAPIINAPSVLPDHVFSEEPPLPTPPAQNEPFPPLVAAPTQNISQTCPVHGKPWKTNSRGYYCATKVGTSPDGRAIWCDRKPVAA